MHLFGFVSWIGGHDFPRWEGNENGGFYAGSVVVIRDEQGRYRMKEVNGRSTPSKPSCPTSPYPTPISTPSSPASMKTMNANTPIGWTPRWN